MRAMQRPGGEHAKAWAGAMRQLLSATLGLAPTVHAWLSKGGGEGGGKGGEGGGGAGLAVSHPGMPWL
eukprot:scaffold107869_cov53-Phaeocystis_antarctica.AAC.1